MARWLLYIMSILAIVTTSSNCSREETSELYAKSGSPPAVQQEGEQVQWFTFNDGLAKAKTDNLPMFMEFYTEWCVACKAFHRETLGNENVAKILGRNFVSVRINAEDKDDRNKYGGKYYSSVGLTYSFGITVFPSLVFLDSGGQILTKIHGFVPPTQFSAILNYIHQKCYETKITLQEFVRQGKCN
jgi:thioredoxin-related protein